MKSLNPTATAKLLHDLPFAVVRDQRHGFSKRARAGAGANPLGSAVSTVAWPAD
jgi:hypothetical protein